MAFWMACAIIAFSACEKEITEDYQEQNGEKTQMILRFTVDGDFGSPTFSAGDGIAVATTTRALTADGKEMTDLWVLDYQGGALVQQIHQQNTEEDFGQPQLPLDYGAHHLYFVASRGTAPSLSTDGHTITWAKTSDTFWKDYSVTVTTGTAATHNVTLNRVSTKLSVSILDEIPEGAATIELTPATWYYGLDYTNGAPAASMNNEHRPINIPATYIGTAGEITASIFGMSTAEEWTTDVSVIARDADDNIIGQANIVAAPFKANRVTNYSCNLFSGGGAFSIIINDTWDTQHSGTW